MLQLFRAREHRLSYPSLVIVIVRVIGESGIALLLVAIVALGFTSTMTDGVSKVVIFTLALSSKIFKAQHNPISPWSHTPRSLREHGHSQCHSIVGLLSALHAVNAA